MSDWTLSFGQIFVLGLSLLFWLLTLGLLVLPFYPTWREWRHPSDDTPLAWPGAAQEPLGPIEPLGPMGRIEPMGSLASLTTLQPSSAVPTSAVPTAAAPVGETMVPMSLLAHSSHERPHHPARTPSSHTAFTPPNAQPWGAQGWRVQGDCQLPKGSYLPGSLVVTGQLLCGPDSVIEGDVKAHGLIRLDPGSLLMGALVGNADISVGPDAEVFGPVLAQGTVRLATRARIGRSEHPTSLSAQRLLAHRQAVVHGQVLTPETGAST